MSAAAAYMLSADIAFHGEFRHADARTHIAASPVTYIRHVLFSMPLSVDTRGLSKYLPPLITILRVTLILA